MGLADFLAEAGNHTAIGQVAQAFGGRTSRQQAVDDFINNQLPALAQEIQANTDENKIPQLGMKFVGAALKAGIPAQNAEKLMDMTIGPALHGIRTEGLNKLFAQYAGQPAQPGESRPQGTEGPLTPNGNFIDPKAATPDKPIDLNFVGRFGQLTRANPTQFNQMLGTPVENAGKQLSNLKTQQAIDQENRTQETIKGLPNVRPAEGQPSAQEVAQINRPGITQFVLRDKPEDPLQEKRGAVLDAQIANLTRLANLPPPGSAPAHGSAEYQDYIKLLPPGQAPTMEGFQQYLQQRRGAGKPSGDTETTADQPYGSIDREIDLKTIAKEAHAQGKTTPEGIREVAKRRGVVIEGDPQLTGGRNAFQRALGAGEEPTLTGDFQIKRAPRVTTRTKTPAGQGRYSEGVPGGSAPVPQGSAAGGAQGKQAAPKRLKFDAKGNQIQ